MRLTGSCILAAMLCGAPSLHAQEVEFSSSNLPIIILETDGNPIPDEPKVPAVMGIIDGDDGPNVLTAPFTEYAGPVAIELRGNSSLDYPKTSFLFKTRDANDEDLNVGFLGFPDEHEWILYASYVDKTLIRNTLAYRVANEMGRYASRTRYCELVIDGSYHGVYVLQEKIKRDKNRVNVQKMTPEDKIDDPLTGGYILTIDHSGKETQKGFPGAFDSTGYFVYWYAHPSAKKITLKQEDYIQRFIKDFEELLRRDDFTEIDTGYARYIDLDSFVDFILLNEWTNNVDGFVASVYLYKDRDSRGDGKLHAGPIWDQDLGFGNAFYENGGLASGWRIHQGRIPFWWRRLLQDTVVTRRLESRWHELRSTALREPFIEHLIDSLTSLLDEAKTRNFQRWPILGQYVWPNAFVGENYQQEIDYLKRWIRNRMRWMDENIHNIGTPDSITIVSVNGEFVPGKVSLELSAKSGRLHVSYHLPAAETTRLLLLDALGRTVHTGESAHHQPGLHSVSWDVHHLPSGVYHVSLYAQGTSVRTSRVVLLK